MINEFPILEYDDDRDAFIRPERFIAPIEGIAENAVICFFLMRLKKFYRNIPIKLSPICVAKV